MKKLKISLLCSAFLIGMIYFFVILIQDNPITFELKEQIIIGLIKQMKVDGNNLQITIKTEKGTIQGFYTIASEIEKNMLSSWNLGDMVEINGEVLIPNDSTIFNGFSYRHYLYSKKIYHTISIDSIKKIRNNQNFFYRIKNGIIEQMRKSNNEKYLKTFLLGDKSLLEEELIESYQKNGVSHLFAISGMHISLFVSILSWLLHRLKHKHFILSIFFCFYAFLTGFTPSIIRATVLFIFVGSRIKPIYVLGILSFILLLYNPFIIYDMGFLFSFVISGYLLLFGKKMETIKNPIIRLWWTSFFCFVVSIPISILSFHEVFWLSSFFNIFFVPLVSYLVFPLTLVCFIFPFLDFLLSIVLTLMEQFSLICNTFSLSTSMYHISLFIFMLYYILITLSLIKPKLGILFVIVIIFHIFYKNIDGSSYITMLDVGQGDSILLEMSHNRNILIDTGGIISYTKEDWQARKKETNLAKNKIIPYLKSRGIHKLEALILTHGDADHLGEALHLLERFSIKQVIMNSGNNNAFENQIIEYCSKHNITYQQISRQTLTISNQMFSFLNDVDSENENEDSLIFYTKMQGKNVLFMGDAGKESEEEILNNYRLPNIDILKVGHHGSKNSSGKSFIDTIQPQYAIIGVGKNNRYKHPHQEALEVLNNSRIYRTDINGSIQIQIKKNGYKIKTCGT